MQDEKMFLGKKIIDANDKYYGVYFPEHHLASKNGIVLVHRAVAELVLGRKLKPEESVHHKDKKKHNNDPANLMVFATTGDHAAFHNGAKIQKQGDVWIAIKKSEKQHCIICGKEITGKKFCLSCYKGDRQNKIPSRVQLETFLKKNYSYSKIGREYNVSGNAVKKWLKKYNLYSYQFKELPNRTDFIEILKNNSMNNIKKKYNVDKYTINRFIRDLNIKIEDAYILNVNTGKRYKTYIEAASNVIMENALSQNLKYVARKIKKSVENKTQYYGEWKYIEKQIY